MTIIGFNCMDATQFPTLPGCHKKMQIRAEDKGVLFSMNHSVLAEVQEQV